MKHKHITRRALALTSLVLALLLTVSVIGLRDREKSLAAKQRQNPDATTSSGDTPGTVQAATASTASTASTAFTAFKTKYKIREKQLPYWLRHPEKIQELKELTPEMAKLLLLHFKGEWLNLNGLTTLDAETAKALAEFKGDDLILTGEAKRALEETK